MKITNNRVRKQDFETVQLCVFAPPGSRLVHWRGGLNPESGFKGFKSIVFRWNAGRILGLSPGWSCQETCEPSTTLDPLVCS